MKRAAADDVANIIPLPKKASDPRAPSTLTQRVVDQAKPRSERYEISDHALPGFVVRISSGGAKTYYVRTRVGFGRRAKGIRVQVGNARVLRLAEAREEARRIIVEARSGVDPTAASPDRPLAAHLDEYEAELLRRNVVKTADRMTTLRRGLSRPPSTARRRCS